MLETSAFHLSSPSEVDLVAVREAWDRERNRHTLDTDTHWWRVLRARNEKDAIDYAKACFPSPTPSRFSPIKDAKGEIVPNAYAGNSDRLALWEIVLRNIRHEGIRRVPAHETQDRYLVQVKSRRKLSLLDVRRPKDTSLVKEGMRPPDLTQAWPAAKAPSRLRNRSNSL